MLAIAHTMDKMADISHDKPIVFGFVLPPHDIPKSFGNQRSCENIDNST